MFVKKSFYRYEVASGFKYKKFEPGDKVTVDLEDYSYYQSMVTSMYFEDKLYYVRRAELNKLESLSAVRKRKLRKLKKVMKYENSL